MRRDTNLPPIPATTPWAKAAVTAMKYIRVNGYAAWLEKEATNPTLADDPDWIAWIAHERGKGPPPRFHERPEDLVHVQTYRCARCRDRDFETIIDTVTGKLYTRRCEACRPRRDAEIRATGPSKAATEHDKKLEERRQEDRRKRQSGDVDEDEP